MERMMEIIMDVLKILDTETKLVISNNIRIPYDVGTILIYNEYKIKLVGILNDIEKELFNSKTHIKNFYTHYLNVQSDIPIKMECLGTLQKIKYYVVSINDKKYFNIGCTILDLDDIKYFKKKNWLNVDFVKAWQEMISYEGENTERLAKIKYDIVEKALKEG